jgi:hypothetical protein
MGLLVAGITGGASLIDNARITSLKREVDDYIRDVFTFYSKVGRLPGDLNNSAQIGFRGAQTYNDKSFPNPYDKTGINTASGPFIDLYVYEISSFRPDSSKAGITNAINPSTVKTNIANLGGIPFSKVYKDFMYMHRYESYDSKGNDANYFIYNMLYKTAINIFTTEVLNVDNKKTADITKKIDMKFDDGTHNGGYIRAYCLKTSGANGGYQTYNDVLTVVCSEVVFYFDVL